MSQRCIVVLGGTGFVGRHLVPKLVSAGWTVRVLSRNRDGRRGVAVGPNVVVENCDVYAASSLQRALTGAHAVINLVGILNEPGRDGRGFARAHVDLTQTLIDACKAAGVRRLLQMSALNAGQGSSFYLRSRGDAELRIEQSGLDWTVFRPSVIFGRGDGLFSRFAGLLKVLPVLPLARANARFMPVYVGDVASAIVRALDLPAAIGQRYALLGPQAWSLRELVRYTADLLQRRRWIIALPDWAARMQAAICDFIPGKPFSSDNFRSLLLDSVSDDDGLARLGIEKTPIAAIEPALFGRAGWLLQLDTHRERLLCY